MKLLIDHNLSPKLLRILSPHFPDSEHVRNLGMRQASDTEIWNYAKTHDFTIISKDADFHQRSFHHGFPPKVVGILGGNCPTSVIEKMLLSNIEAIRRFCEDETAAFLQLVLPGR